jgi:hypothetical protein
LNKSGSLHISEVLDVISKAISVCREITNGSVELGEMMEKLAKLGDHCGNNLLVKQLIQNEGDMV